MVQEDIEDFLRYLRERDAVQQRITSENTIMAYRSDLEQFRSFLEAHGCDSWDVTASDIVEYKRDLDARYVKATTRARKIASVRALYRFLVREHRVHRDPAKALTMPPPVKRAPEVVTETTLQQLVAAVGCSETATAADTAKALRDRAMLRLMIASGLLPSELVALDIDDVIGSAIHVRSGNRSRVVHADGKAREALDAYLASGRLVLNGSASERALFVNARGGRLTRQGFWLIVKQYAQRAGLAGVSPRVLRHSCAAVMLHNGAGLSDVQHLLGHAHTSSTKAYAHTRLHQEHDVAEE
ncbi:MAG: tyrosine-type recombinase/integrase [Chloroflexi bacterium]|nr:tyrosine-type recombinase/integrase [Chloroflexota bacterium]